MRKNVTIYVKESSPKLGEVMTMTLTYPIAKIELHFNPNKIEVLNIDTFSKYKRVE